MRTTVDIDRDLLERAKRALDATTYKETIRHSLEDVIKDTELRDAVDSLKGSDLSWRSVDEFLAWRRGNAD